MTVHNATPDEHRTATTQRVESALQRNDALFRSVVETADSGIVTIDQRGLIIAFNRAAERMFGYPEQSATGLPVAILLPDRLRPACDACLQRCLADGDSPIFGRTHELVAQRCDDIEFPIELTLSMIQDRSETIFVAIIRDATERKRLDAERTALLASTTEYARRLSDLAVLKADFTAMVAHEMSTPLAAIRAMTDLLAKGSITPDDHLHLLSAIQAEVGLLTRLVSDVQSVGNMERDDFVVRPRAVPIGVLLAEAIAHAGTLPGNHPVSMRIEASDMVLADPERIGQVLRNLLNNAARYSPAGAPIELRAARNVPYVRIAVADQGYGIRADDLERIFVKFGRGRDRGGHRPDGLGLGLYLSRRIVQAHGSDLFVTSAPGEGSIFGFDLEVAT
ncbi:MAG: PAS domain S-box protein [Chloroflexota bacterium]|nr:PAS domain S-box protein [Chloroflexota bacterium]